MSVQAVEMIVTMMLHVLIWSGLTSVPVTVGLEVLALIVPVSLTKKNTYNSKVL